MKKARNYIITMLIILLFTAGAFIFSFPYISNVIHTRNQSRVIESYQNSIDTLDEKYLNETINEARQYNKNLMNNPHRFFPTQEELKHYHNMLKTESEIYTDIIGTLEVQHLNMTLPIYLGTDEETLMIGLGHIEGTSLPVGGSGTHTVITGHRGLHTAKLLTDIDRMEIGDIFVLNILNLRLYYITDQITIVLPDDMSDLTIYPEKDYATLLTCTPIGVNTHRLLVRGVRIPDEHIPSVIQTTENYQANTITYIKLIVTLILLIIFIIILLLIKRLIKENKNNRNRKGKLNAISSSRKTKRR